MKRSQHASLVLMAVTPLLMTACSNSSNTAHAVPEPQPTVAAYEDVEACNMDGRSASDCQKAMREAEEQKPRFASQKECEKEFSDCRENVIPGTGNQSAFSPMLMGFIMGRTMDGSSGGGSTSSFQQGRGLYRDRGGSLTQVAKTSSGQSVMNAYHAPLGNKTSVSQAQASARSASVSRGGFGRSGRSFGG